MTKQEQLLFNLDLVWDIKSEEEAVIKLRQLKDDYEGIYSLMLELGSLDISNLTINPSHPYSKRVKTS